MATNMSISLRCQSKGLVVGSDAINYVTVSLYSVASAGGAPVPTTSSLTTTVLAASDTFVIGNMYTVAISDAAME